MRSFLWGIIPLVVLAGFVSQQRPSRAQSDTKGAARLFLGDHDCGDNLKNCLFPRTYTPTQYLHVLLHDLPGNDDWQVQSAPACSAQMPVVAEGLPIGPTGYREIVIDVSAMEGTKACYVFRGRHHYILTFYAAYFDANPAADATIVLPGFDRSNGVPDLPDLDVSYVHRTPALAYDGHPNQPSEGQLVTWTAHVRNVGVRPASEFSYRWRMDGGVIQTGTASGQLAVGGGVALSLSILWHAGPHRLTFQILTNQEEIGYANNQLTVRTDALTLGFWVEQSAWSYFERNQWHYCRELACSTSNSFTDWLQRQVSAWNELFARSIFSNLAPTGVADRVRLDEVTVVPDGTLPLHGGISTNTPDLTDHTVDLEWGLPSVGVEHVYRRQSDGPFDVDWGLIHELGHARSLADLYRFDIAVSDAHSVDIRDTRGRLLFDQANPLAPENTLRAFYSEQGSPVLFQNAERDLMSCTCTTGYSAYTTLVLNRIRSRRARCGNVNAPCNLGDWFLDLPPRNVIQVIDSQGTPIAPGTVVQAYADTATSYTGHHFDQTHVSTLLTGRDGKVILGSDPFGSHGDLKLAGHNLLLLEVRAPRTDTFCFVEPTLFNLAFWSGYRDARHPAVYRLRLGRQDENDCKLALPTPLLNEPFGVSPISSSAILTTSAGRQVIRVQLRDDATPARNMRNRRIEIRSASGQVLTTGITNAGGIAILRVPGRTASLHLVDVTDNDLVLPVGAEVQSRPMVQRR